VPQVSLLRPGFSNRKRYPEKKSHCICGENAKRTCPPHSEPAVSLSNVHSMRKVGERIPKKNIEPTSRARDLDSTPKPCHPRRHQYHSTKLSSRAKPRDLRFPRNDMPPSNPDHRRVPHPSRSLRRVGERIPKKNIEPTSRVPDLDSTPKPCSQAAPVPQHQIVIPSEAEGPAFSRRRHTPSKPDHRPPKTA
jgi:hypothetical protein